jgi:hypothetical protein
MAYECAHLVVDGQVWLSAMDMVAGLRREAEFWAAEDFDSAASALRKVADELDFAVLVR